MLSRRGARQSALPITILVTVAALLTARATAVPVTGSSAQLDRNTTQSCTAITSEQLNAVGKRSVDELVNKLPNVSNSGQQQPCPQPPGQPAFGVHFQSLTSSLDQLEDDADKTLDKLEDAMDDCDEAAVNALIPKLEQLSKQAHEAADTGKTAGQFGRIRAIEANAMARDLDEAIGDAKNFKCLLRHPRGYQILPLSPFEERTLYLHNIERSEVHAEPLRWNFKLEWDAIGYADQMAETHQLIHAPREGRGIERENLLQANIGWTPDRMMQSWTMEKRYFHAGFFPDVCAGEWTHCAHYTQMIWPTTTDIGCGYAEGGGYGWLVCRYSPGGNKDGKPVGIANPMPERG
ncbi:MAG: CAP domain-containing protein [Sphingomicrobium sp.]